MDLNRVEPIVFQKNEKEESVLTDPHLYLCLVIAGMMLMMSLVACSHVEPNPEPMGTPLPTPISKSDLNKQELGK